MRKRTYTARTLAMIASVLVAASATFGGTAGAARLKDLALIDGVRENQLIGFGLVGGLAGTGDDPKNAPYTAEAIANMLSTFGFQFEPRELKVKNFAGVMVTANMPAYVNDGDRLDVTVSSIGSAKSLEGGFLYQTLLRGADNDVYAAAQGPLSLGSVVGGGGGGGRTQQHATVARIPGGALIEASVPSTILKSDGGIRLNLNQPDFTTAAAVVEAVNSALGGELARAEDAGAVSVRVPLAYLSDMVPFIALIENLDVSPGGVARVVVNQRTGTVVLGHNVEILPVAVTHGSMTLTFGEEVAAPGLQDGTGAANGTLSAATSLGNEATEVMTPSVSETGAETTAQPLGLLEGSGSLRRSTTAEQVAAGLNKMNLSPQDIVAVFEAIDAAGALLGRLEII